jgi:hypothetical protein
VNGVSIELSTLSRQRHHRFVDEDDYGAGAGHDADDEASRV